MEVWATGIVSPLAREWALGLPGLDVEEEVALEEDARADLDLGVAVDRLAVVVDAEGDVGVVAGAGPVQAVRADALHAPTLPTLTPAIRTGESLRMLAAFLKTAWSSKWLWNGIDLVQAR